MSPNQNLPPVGETGDQNQPPYHLYDDEQLIQAAADDPYLGSVLLGLQQVEKLKQAHPDDDHYQILAELAAEAARMYIKSVGYATTENAPPHPIPE